MFARPQTCPNSACSSHSEPEGRWWWKRGTYKTRHNHQPVARYQCRMCGQWFSASFTRPRRKQHRPSLNSPIFHLLVSGVTTRRASVILGCDRKTIERKVVYLVHQIQQQHAAWLSEQKTGHIMMDELITFIHARPKKVSAAVAVRVSTGQVLGFTVCRTPAPGPSQQKYRWWNDDRARNIPKMLSTLAPTLKAGAWITTDADPSYGKWIKAALPGARHQAVKAVVSKLAQKAATQDPLFAINLTFAKMRNDLPRLGRKTWTTSKSLAGLERHLWLWVAWKNGYSLR